MTLRSLLLSLGLLCPALLTGCAGDPNAPSPDAGGTDVVPPDSTVRIAVSGVVEVYPPAQAWLDQSGQAGPALEGLRLRLEEPLYGALGDPNALLGEVTLGPGSSFRVTDVPVQDLTIGLVARLEDPAVDTGGQARVVPACTVLYDTTREGKRPELDLGDRRVWALPPAYLDALTHALGPGRLASLAPGKTHLREAGFVLGQVVDARGAPVAGAKVTVSPADLAGRVFYPAADLSSAHQTGTSASGLFVLVHDGGDVRTFTLTVDGRTDFPRHSGTAARGTGLVMPVLPDQP